MQYDKCGGELTNGIKNYTDDRRYGYPSNPEDNYGGKVTADNLTISDGFHSIKVNFTQECLEEMEDVYPSCITVQNLDYRLICVKDYEVELIVPFNDIENIAKNAH